MEVVAQSLSKDYGRTRAVDDVSFGIAPGRAMVAGAQAPSAALLGAELANVDPRYLTLSSGTAFLTVDGLWLNWLVFTAYGLVFLGIAWAVFQRRDA